MIFSDPGVAKLVGKQHEWNDMVRERKHLLSLRFRYYSAKDRCLSLRFRCHSATD